MPNYRVYIRRPNTIPPEWNWRENVVANNAVFALTQAYANWVNSHPAPPPPPLGYCTTKVVQINATTMAAALKAGDDPSTISPAQQAFITNIQQKVSEFLSTQLNGTFQVVSYPSGFHYGITYGNNAYYNSATLRDIDSLLGVADNGQLQLTGAGFSGLYAQLLPAITFTFSQADLDRMNKQDAAAAGQIASVISEFSNAGGTLSNPLPFGGAIQDIFNQLIKQFGSLANIPNTMNPLRNAIAAYQSLAGDSYAMHNRYYVATAALAAALKNITAPSAANGGMQTSASTFYDGYSPDLLPSANKLIGGLNTSSNAVGVDISLSSFTSTSSNMKIGGGLGFSIPIADILNISIGGSASYSVAKYTSQSSTIKMNLNYPGVTLFAATPSELSTDSSTGWYDNQMLKEVVANTGKDATGFALQGSEFNIGDLFGTGKAFSRLKTFVISQQPTITMIFSAADNESIVKELQVNASASIDLFGLFSLGSVSGSYHVQNVTEDSKEGTVTVTLGPPQASGTIPLQQQVAYVMGGVASYPPNND
ncbi:MAG TPA: hypothetical protein VGM89_09245 [Puia sp.]